MTPRSPALAASEVAASEVAASEAATEVAATEVAAADCQGIMRRALADPVRLRILESLWEGPKTAKAMGDRLGILPNRLYYHLRTMEEAGLVAVVGAELGGRLAERVYGATNLQFGDELMGSPSEERTAVLAAMFLATAEEVAQVDRRGGTITGATRGVLRTTPEALARAVDGVVALIEEARRAGGDAQAVDYRFATVFYDPSVISGPGAEPQE
ncbi:MAG TPA: winged helix-turn-helix domain-containing protein, partial [Acidimicrobiales bacterium]|nr:winged helix-turn-helix domain-containing protein [Acidimicrobiales bacterium]